jgi:hypothetical protein
LEAAGSRACPDPGLEGTRVEAEALVWSPRLKGPLVVAEAV